MTPPRRAAVGLCAVLLLATASAEPGPAEKVQVNLVLIDLVARDGKDRPATGLRRDDLVLLIDNIKVDPADLVSFEEVCGASPAAGDAPVPAGQAEPATAPSAASSTRNIILYFDFQQMTVAARGLALEAARGFVLNRVAPPDRVMIVAYIRDLRLLQRFTADRKLLLQALDTLKADNSSAAEDPFGMQQDLAGVSGTSCTLDRYCPQRMSAASAFASAEASRARRSLQSMRDLLPILSVIRGRKAVVLFTDVLRAEPGAQFFPLAYGKSQPPGLDVTSDLLSLAREANDAGVSFYTVHASGLDDNTHEPFREARGNTFTLGGKPGRGTQPEVSEVDRVDNSASYDAIRAGRDSALALQSTLAVETGGRAIQRTNDLGAVIDSAHQDLSCYYMVGYRHHGPGDGGRHEITVLPSPGARKARGKVTFRHRPSFHDISAAGRVEAALGAALRTPGLFQAVPLTVEAFALAPRASGRGVLVKTTARISSFFLAPSSTSTLKGGAVVRGEVRRDGTLVCTFEDQLPIEVPHGDARSLIYEAGCILAEGAYDVSVAILDQATREVGARRAPLVVPSSKPSGGAYMSEVSLWTRDPDSILIASGTSTIGIGEVAGREAFIPQAERRLNAGQEARLSFMICTRSGAEPGSPIRVRRQLKGSEDRSVASFRELVIEDPPDAATGCYQISSSIPAGTLGAGIYRFAIEATGQPLGAPIRREVDLAVETP